MGCRGEGLAPALIGPRKCGFALQFCAQAPLFRDARLVRMAPATAVGARLSGGRESQLMTFNNACEARRAGFRWLHDGKCAGTFRAEKD